MPCSSGHLSEMGVDDRINSTWCAPCLESRGVKQMVADFHRRGQVLFPMMMWDEGTRDPQASWPDAIAD